MKREEKKQTTKDKRKAKEDNSLDINLHQEIGKKDKSNAT